MKIILMTLLLSSQISARSIVPERIVTPSLELFSAREQKTGEMKVPVVTYSRNGEFNRAGTKILLSKEKYAEYLNPAQAVFEMVPNQNSGDEERKGRRGTAFHIGENLVLTNNHVLDETFGNQTECSDFEVLDHKRETYDCKKVHFCSKEHDVCLIEMKTKTKTKRDCFLCSGTKYEVSLSQGPALKLKATYHPDSANWQSEIMTAIGNSQGWGIHFSQGRGVTVQHERIYFWAPISKGNSGGALLNNEGLVVGVVKLQSKVLTSPDPNVSYNIAASSELVISLIRDALADDPETLLKFNKAVVQ